MGQFSKEIQVLRVSLYISWEKEEEKVRVYGWSISALTAFFYKNTCSVYVSLATSERMPIAESYFHVITEYEQTTNV